MRKAKYTEGQMVKILREADKTPVAEVTKQYGMSGETIYAWCRRLGAMTADEAKRMKALESESFNLKRCSPSACSRSTC